MIDVTGELRASRTLCQYVRHLGQTVFGQKHQPTADLIEILGAIYDVVTGKVTFLERDGSVLAEEKPEEVSTWSVYGAP